MMSPTPITSFDQVSPQWLTRVLKSADALDSGVVEALNIEKTERILSKNARITVRYSMDATGEMPRNLFLKITGTNMEDEFFGPSEVNYYVRDYLDVKGIPLLRCYEAVYASELESYHILLDDVSDTHAVSRHKTPTLAFGLALAQGLGRMHARWWGPLRFGALGEPVHSAEHINRYVDIARPGLPNIENVAKWEIDSSWYEIMRTLFEKHPPAMAARTNDPNGFTIVHGDVNPSNILVPKDADTPIYLIDRQPFDWSLTTWLGVQDLAYAMGLHWAPELRRAFENTILRRYYQTLLRNGVVGYSWERLFDDYRLSLGQNIYIAVEWCRGQEEECRDHKPFWLPMLKNAMKAVIDLDCPELWK